jgi:hypothetical protein
MIRHSLGLIVVGLLTACVPETPGAQLTTAPVINGDAMLAAAPPVGSAPVPAQVAIDFFSIVCLNPAPTFAASPAALQGNDFVQNPGTGTWFHPVLNLSVNLTDGCSMVIVTDEPPALIPLSLTTASIIALRGEDDTEITVGTDPGADIQISPSGEAARAAGPGGLITTVERTRVLNGDTYYRALLTRP